jgi:drug/metabolite transporter (DMT)-like permease
MNTFLFFLCACFWGASFVAIKMVVAVQPPVFGTALRIFTSVVFLAIVYLLTGRSFHLPKTARFKVWTAGLFSLAFPLCLLYWGERFISPGLGGILNGTVPMWTFLFGIFFLSDERNLSMRRLGGIVLGLAGIVVICFPRVALTGTRDEALGVAAVVLMAVSYATGAILNRRFMVRNKDVNIYTNLIHQQSASFIAVTCIYLLFEGPARVHWEALSGVIMPTLYLGCVSTGLAFMIFFRLIRDWGAVRAAAITYVVPITAVLFDFLFNGALPTPNDLIGAVCILVSIYLVHH